MRGVLKNAVIHLHNEQPLLGDLLDMPSPADVAVRLTNLRSLDGKRPIFVDDMKSIFIFAYHRISFIEIPASSVAGADQAAQMPVAAVVTAAVAAAANSAHSSDQEADLEIDEDFLRRIREV
jgi:hypothetical protein